MHNVKQSHCHILCIIRAGQLVEEHTFKFTATGAFAFSMLTSFIIFQFSDRICWREGEIYTGSRFHYLQSGADLGSELSQNQDHLFESENTHARLLLDDSCE